MLYETSKDRSNQDRVADLLEHKWRSITVKQTSTEALHDFDIYRNGRLYALAEYKRRKKKYTTLAIDVSKINHLKSEAERKNAKPILFVEWGDGLYWVEPTKNYPVESGFKRVRGSELRCDHPSDVCHISIADFTKI